MYEYYRAYGCLQLIVFLDLLLAFTTKTIQSTRNNNPSIHSEDYHQITSKLKQVVKILHKTLKPCICLYLFVNMMYLCVYIAYMYSYIVSNVCMVHLCISKFCEKIRTTSGLYFCRSIIMWLVWGKKSFDDLFFQI